MQKYVSLVDLVKSFPTSIYFQKSASIQPRTSLSKFGGKFNSLFIRLLGPRRAAPGAGAVVVVVVLAAAAAVAPAGREDAWDRNDRKSELASPLLFSPTFGNFFSAADGAVLQHFERSCGAAGGAAGLRCSRC